VKKGEKNRKIKVACVGDSITYGTMVLNRKRNSYPSQLGQMLGHRYQVENFGINGYTMLKSAEKSYWKTKEFLESIRFVPDIVLIMLGTNDSKEFNWTGMNHYLRDYHAMIEFYEKHLPGVKIFILTPATAFQLRYKKSVSFSINNTIIKRIRKALIAVSDKNKINLIDIYSATKRHPGCFWFDGVHPNGKGAGIIAEHVYRTLHSC